MPEELRDGSPATIPAEYEISMKTLDIEWLPAPYVPQVVRAKGDWRYEPRSLAVFSSRKKSGGLTYRVSSLLPNPSAELLNTPEFVDQAGPLGTYLVVPVPTPDVVARELQRITGAKRTPYEKAVALQEWFHNSGEFRYTLEVPAGTTSDHIGSFLRRKSGYCEQFAATMAYMARLAGIPARVAIGFTPGALQDDGSYAVTNHDAHAWPELYFPTAGWLRFEPTPRDASTARPSYAAPPTAAVPTTPVPGQPEPTPSATPTLPNRLDDVADLGAGAEPDTAPSDAGGGGGPRVLVPALIAVFVLLLLTPGLSGELRRRQRWRRAGDHVERIHAAWDAFADAAEDAGLPLRPSDSPRRAARRLVEAGGLSGEAATAAGVIARAEELARYARSAPPVDGLVDRVATVRTALLASRSRTERWRILLLPPSTLREARTAVSETTSRVDEWQSAKWRRLGAALRARLRFARS